MQVWDTRTDVPQRSIFGPHITGDSMDQWDNYIVTGSWRPEKQLQVYMRRCQCYRRGRLRRMRGRVHADEQTHCALRRACVWQSDESLGAPGAGRRAPASRNGAPDGAPRLAPASSGTSALASLSRSTAGQIAACLACCMPRNFRVTRKRPWYLPAAGAHARFFAYIALAPCLVLWSSVPAAGSGLGSPPSAASLSH